MKEPTAKQLRKFHKACSILGELSQEGFHLYLAMSTLNLMSGPSHDDICGNGTNPVPRRDRVVAQNIIHNMGGGDW